MTPVYYAAVALQCNLNFSFLLEHKIVKRDQSPACEERFHLMRFWRAEESVRKGIGNLMDRHNRMWDELDIVIDQE